MIFKFKNEFDIIIDIIIAHLHSEYIDTIYSNRIDKFQLVSDVLFNTIHHFKTYNVSIKCNCKWKVIIN